MDIESDRESEPDKNIVREREAELVKGKEIIFKREKRGGGVEKKGERGREMM